MFPGLAFIFIGVILLLETLDVISKGLGTYWPIILGADFLTGHRRMVWWQWRRH